MTSTYPDGVALVTYYVNSSLVKRVEDALEYSVFENNGWVDVTVRAGVCNWKCFSASLCRRWWISLFLQKMVQRC